jgi:hypothetical protein
MPPLRRLKQALGAKPGGEDRRPAALVTATQYAGAVEEVERQRAGGIELTTAPVLLKKGWITAARCADLLRSERAGSSPGAHARIGKYEVVRDIVPEG